MGAYLVRLVAATGGAGPLGLRRVSRGAGLSFGSATVPLPIVIGNFALTNFHNGCGHALGLRLEEGPFDSINTATCLIE